MVRPFSFLHTGDLHLDTPFSGMTGLVPPEVSQRLREATLTAWDRIVDLAIERRVDFVVVAGDVFESETGTLRGQFAFSDGLARLEAAGIPAGVVHGNHDPLSGWQPTVPWPATTSRFGGDAPAAWPVVKDGVEIARVYGMSYAQKAETRDLAARFRRDDDAPFAIGLLHATVGLTDRHVRYAPTTLETLAASGMDYWALGHIHRRRIERQAKPMVVYPGCPQGRDPGEAEAKGVAIVRVDGSGTPALEWIDTDVVRWVLLEIPCAPLESMTDLRTAIITAVRDARAAAGRSIVAHIRLTGFTPLHQELIRADIYTDLVNAVRAPFKPGEPSFAWIETLADETRSDADAAYAKGRDFVAELDGLVRATHGEAVADHEPLDVAALAAELYRDPKVTRAVGVDGLEIPELEEILDEARTLVLDRLRSTGGMA
jgi:DNA repair protein SbcD/Mre11